MTIKLDWKFYVMLIATAAGVAAPIWLWKADLQAKSLNLRIVSRAPLILQLAGQKEPAKELTVTLDGTELKLPHITNLQLTNDGARPIPASDYEEAIEIQVTGGAKLIRANISELSPPDLAPKFATTATTLIISPLLLNPADTITFTVITADAPPQFSVRTRVAGIPRVLLQDTTEKTLSATQIAARILAAMLLLFIYTCGFVAVLAPKRYYFSAIPIALSAFTSIGVATALLEPAQRQLGLTEHWQQALGLVALAILSGLVALPLSRRKPVP